MEAKFKELQSVIVDGTATGYGDLKGYITEINYCSLSEEMFYTVRITDEHLRPSEYVSERFLIPTENPK